MNTQESPKSHRFSTVKQKTVLGIFVSLVLLIAAGVYIFYTFQRRQMLALDPAAMQQEQQKAAQEEAKKLTSEVSRIMILPAELPTIATVTDIEKLKNQLFFQKAHNGDKVLIFSKAKIALIYNPETKKIINVGSLNVIDKHTQNTSTPAQAKIVLRNGTDIPKLAAKAEMDLQKAFPGIDIRKKEQATSSNYDKTIVIALNPNAQSSAAILAKFYNVTVTELPAKELKPDGMDILVILGTDSARMGGVAGASEEP